MKSDIVPAVAGEHNLKDYNQARETFDFSQVAKEFSWHNTGKVNIVHEALDRQVLEKGLGDRVALYYADGTRDEQYTFARLMDLSDRFAGALYRHGVRQGDRVGIFLPRSPEWYISFLGAARLGAVVVPLFEAFMEDALLERLGDSGARALITNPELLGRVPLRSLPALQLIFTVGEYSSPGNSYSWWAEVKATEASGRMEWVNREDPLFILYAAGADGRARGLVHVHDTMVGLWITGLWVHDLHPGDVYWCTADPGWITGLAYGFLTPWLHGIPVVIRGGRFRAQEWCETLSRYGVTVWYSAPTAFRMIIEAGPGFVKDYNLSRLRHILSVGEPLTHEVLEWSLSELGQPIYDTWWMSETGMNMICQFRCLNIKLGSIGQPFPGLQAAVVDDEGQELPPGRIGNLALKAGWPSMARGVWKNQRLYEAYFTKPPWFISGDAAYRDENGYFYFQGRVDGLINTAGERVGPVEVETVLKQHPAVADAGVTGKPDRLRGEIVMAYIVLQDGLAWSEELSGELRQHVKRRLAAHAAPRGLEPREFIPKAAGGSVDRRKLKEWALGLTP